MINHLILCDKEPHWGCTKCPCTCTNGMCIYKYAIVCGYILVTLMVASVDEERTAAELLSDTNVELSPDGTVSWTTPAMIKSACKIEIDSYPFDVQRCQLKLGSWTYNGFEVNVTAFLPIMMMDNLMPNGEWRIIAAPCKRHEVYYSCCPQPYPDVTCELIMKRRPLFYLYNLVMPCLLLIFIGESSHLHFWGCFINSRLCMYTL